MTIQQIIDQLLHPPFKPDPFTPPLTVVEKYAALWKEPAIVRKLQEALKLPQRDAPGLCTGL